MRHEQAARGSLRGDRNGAHAKPIGGCVVTIETTFSGRQASAACRRAARLPPCPGIPNSRARLVRQRENDRARVLARLARARAGATRAPESEAQRRFAPSPRRLCCAGALSSPRSMACGLTRSVSRGCSAPGPTRRPRWRGAGRRRCARRLAPASLTLPRRPSLDDARTTEERCAAHGSPRGEGRHRSHRRCLSGRRRSLGPDHRRQPRCGRAARHDAGRPARGQPRGLRTAAERERWQSELDAMSEGSEPRRFEARLCDGRGIALPRGGPHHPLHDARPRAGAHPRTLALKATSETVGGSEYTRRDMPHTDRPIDRLADRLPTDCPTGTSSTSPSRPPATPARSCGVTGSAERRAGRNPRIIP